MVGEYCVWLVGCACVVDVEDVNASCLAASCKEVALYVCMCVYVCEYVCMYVPVLLMLKMLTLPVWLLAATRLPCMCVCACACVYVCM